MNCTKCKLHKFRDSIVVGRGDIPADVLLIGEAPGLSEDALGEAFVGRAGVLLDTMIFDTEIKVSYYITNTVFCRPCDRRGGENREPTVQEVLSCRENLVKIIDKVNPKVFVLIGKIAEKYYSEFKPHFKIQHPAFLLRGGGVAHPYYNRNVRILQNAFKLVKGGLNGEDIGA